MRFLTLKNHNSLALFKNLAVTGVFRAASVGLSFLLTIVVARLLPISEAGSFYFAFSVLSVLSVVLRLGVDNVVMRSVAANGITLDSMRVVNTSLVMVAVLTLSIAFLSVLLYLLMPDSFSGNSMDFRVLIWSVLSTPFIALAFVISYAMQGVGKSISAISYQNLAVTVFFLLALGVGVELDYSMNAQLMFMVYTVLALIVFLVSIMSWRRFVRRDANFNVGYLKELKLNDSDLWRACLNLWVVQLMILAVQWSSVLIGGFYLSVEDFAYLSVAQRTANLTTFLLLVVNLAIAPKFAKLWKEGRIKEIERIAKLTNRLTIVAVIPVIFAMCFFPAQIMSMFGKHFSDGAILLSIFAIGQFVNVATGSVGALLNMSGHESVLRKITVLCGLFTIILSFVAILNWGAIGGAVATATGVTLQSLAAFWAVKRKLGISTL